VCAPKSIYANAGQPCRSYLCLSYYAVKNQILIGFYDESYQSLLTRFASLIVTRGQEIANSYVYQKQEAKERGDDIARGEKARKALG
jgi:hypothetical protein